MKIKHLQILLGGVALLLLTVLFACNKDEKKKSEPQGAKIESISFKMESYSVKINETAGINLKGELKITPVSIVDTCKITWALSDPSIAKITESGVITPVKEGETIVTATVQGKSAQCKYAVKVIHVKEVVVVPAGIAENVNVGSTKKLTANIDPEDATFQTVVWKSSNTAVATVSSDGTVTCKGEGKCTITATVDGKEGKCNVTYSPNIVNVTSVTVTPSSITENVSVGATKKLTAIVKPDNATDKNVTWKSNNTAVATVSSDGTVTCKGIGTATITATADGVPGKCEVKYEKVKVSTVTITPSSYSVEGRVGNTKKLTANVLPSNATDKTVTWKSSNTAVATVSSDGTVTCKGLGTATITATADGVEGKCTAKYEPVKVTGVRIQPSTVNETVSIGATKKLTAIIEPSDATDKTVTWKSNNQAVVTVSSDGTITCRGVGEAAILVTASNNKTSTCNVTYKKIPVTTVKISRPGLAFNAIGQTYKLTAEVGPSNATYKDVTWSSTNTSVATVDNNGLVTCKGFGMATISAKADEKTASILVLSSQDYVIDGCGYVYTSKKIGTQVWMLQNMRCNVFDTQSERAGEELVKGEYVDASDKSRWKDSYSGLDNSQVSQLGYLYDWWDAVGLEDADFETKITGRRQGICPNGWHLPTDAEWKTLENFLGSSTAGKKLKTTSGWSSGNGTDAYSFAALPAGYGYSKVEGVGSYACFWTATPSSNRDDTAISHNIYYNKDEVQRSQYQYKSLGESIRCVKN